MRTAAPVLLVAIALSIAGCTGTPQPRSGDGLTVEYVVRAGEVPADVRSVNVSFRVVFVSNPDDFGPCYPDVFRDPNDPTPTPLSDPSGVCYTYGTGHRGGPITLTLTEPTESRSLGAFTAPPWAAGGHALVVTDVTVIRTDGTRVTDVWDSGFEAIASSTLPDAPTGIELNVERTPDQDYDYRITSDTFDPSSGRSTNSSAVTRRA